MSRVPVHQALIWPGDPAALESDGVDFVAIGHVLGNTCCWGGRSLKFYSLAQHAVTVCDAVGRLGGLGGGDRTTLALHALLADAWRAWLPREGLDGGSAKASQRREREAVQRTVLEAAGVDPALPERWAQALGLTRLMAEAAVSRDLAGAGVAAIARDGGPLFPPLKARVRPQRPDRAAAQWIERCEALRGAEAGASGAQSPAQAPGGGT